MKKGLTKSSSFKKDILVATTCFSQTKIIFLLRNFLRIIFLARKRKRQFFLKHESFCFIRRFRFCSAHAHRQAHTNTSTQAHTDQSMHTRTQKCTHTKMHVPAHKHARTHAHQNTDTHWGVCMVYHCVIISLPAQIFFVLYSPLLTLQQQWTRTHTHV